MTSFTVYLSDPEVPAGLEFAGEAEFQFFENGVLQVADNDQVRYYAPGYWTQVHQGPH
ncbi:hypothetical protein [Nocardia sp. NPDC004750]